ncbi:hypothetical protein NL676_019552, partial [Syzygium grande]
LRDLGRDIVRQNGSLEPEKRSRVWNHEEAIDVLIGKKGTENVEAIRLKFDHQSQHFFKKEEFASLSNLRFLQVDYVHLDTINIQHFSSTNWFQSYLPVLPKLRWLSRLNFVRHFPSTNWLKRNLLILPKLRFLLWHKFPISFQFTAFSLMKLAILDLSYSAITDDWEGWNHLK